MQHELQVLPDADAVAARGAELIAERAQSTVSARGRFAFAASGGDTPWAMYGQLEDHQLPWEKAEIFQTDERVAPAGSQERNLTHLIAALSIGAQGSLRPMPVDDPDLERAASRYEDKLPGALDLIHLGLGPDGHTASLVPADAVLDVEDRLVATTTAEYQGFRRMTLTYPTLNAARELLWIVTGEGKRASLAKLLEGDSSIPAGRIESSGASLILADEAAAPQSS